MPKKIKAKTKKSQHLDIALQYYNSGNFQQAEVVCRQVLTQQPNNAEAWHLLGLIAAQAAQYDDATGCFKKTLELNPYLPEAYNDLGAVFIEKGFVEEAIENFKKALNLQPDSARAYNNLGTALWDKGLIGEAMECYKEALILRPDHAGTYNNLGNMLNSTGLVEAAIESHKKALMLEPDNAFIHADLGDSYLLLKDFEKGWEEYEWRLKIPDVPPLSKPGWDGSSLEGKTILVYSEQGYGDTLQFVRYLPLLYDEFRAKKVLFIPPKGLEQLLRESDLKAEILDAETSVESLEYDTNIHLLSLPRIFKTNLENIPFKQKRYLRANRDKVKSYKEKFFNSSLVTCLPDRQARHSSLIKIGIFWQGSLLFKDAKKKAVPLACFYPLCRLPDVKVYSLQKGYGIEQLKEVPEDIKVINPDKKNVIPSLDSPIKHALDHDRGSGNDGLGKIVNLGKTFNDFSDTAAAIENLDLVITIDTAIAHLSGALGKKTWILLPSYAEWRWHLDMDYSPWYEDVRLFRHKELGKKDWDKMMGRVIKELIEVINQNRQE